MKAVSVYTESRVAPHPNGQGWAGGTFCGVVLGKRRVQPQCALRLPHPHGWNAIGTLQARGGATKSQHIIWRRAPELVDWN